jgi:hypothetical protein
MLAAACYRYAIVLSRQRETILFSFLAKKEEKEKKKGNDASDEEEPACHVKLFGVRRSIFCCSFERKPPHLERRRTTNQKSDVRLLKE